MLLALSYLLFFNVHFVVFVAHIVNSDALFAIVIFVGAIVGAIVLLFLLLLCFCCCLVMLCLVIGAVFTVLLFMSC